MSSNLGTQLDAETSDASCNKAEVQAAVTSGSASGAMPAASSPEKNQPSTSRVANGTGSSSAGSSSGRFRLVEVDPLMGMTSRGPGGAKGWACTPTGQWLRVMPSTALLPNRERDKKRVETSLGLTEFGDSVTQFYAAKSGFCPVGIGYDRVVYGDHGPYLEFSPEQVIWCSFPNFMERPEGCFFDEAWTPDWLTMLYVQKRTVKNKPNPPTGPLSVQNNRSEGYADYRIGKIYLACDSETVAVSRPTTMPRRRRRAGRGRGKSSTGEANGAAFPGSADYMSFTGMGPQDEFCEWQNLGEWDAPCAWDCAMPWSNATWDDNGWHSLPWEDGVAHGDAPEALQGFTWGNGAFYSDMSGLPWSNPQQAEAEDAAILGDSDKLGNMKYAEAQIHGEVNGAKESEDP